MQAPSLHHIWQGLKSEDAPLVLKSLQELTDNRHRLGEVSVAQAQLLLGAAQAPHQGPLQECMQLSLKLLARWAVQSGRYFVPQANNAHKEHLHAVTCWLLQQRHAHGFTPGALAAVTLFLGAAYHGCGTELRPAVRAAVCELLCGSSCGAADLTQLEDMMAGVQMMLQQLMEHPDQFNWLLACTLHFLTSSPPHQTALSGRITASPLALHAPGPRFSWVALPHGHDPDTQQLLTTCWCHHAMQTGVLLQGAMRHLGAAAVQQLSKAPPAGHHTSRATAQQSGHSAAQSTSTGAGPQRPGATNSPARAPSPLASSITTLASAATLLQQACLQPELSSSHSTATAAIALLAAVGLLEGVVLQVRQMPGQQQPGLQRAAQPLLAALTGCIQAAIARSCQIQAQCMSLPSPAAAAAAARTGPGMTGGTARQAAPAPFSSSQLEIGSHPFPSHLQLMFWCTGYAYARLRATPATIALLPQLLPAAPLLPQLPVAAVLALVHCALGLGPLLAHAHSGSTPGDATAWLHQHGRSQVYQDVATLAKCVVEDVRAPDAQFVRQLVLCVLKDAVSVNVGHYGDAVLAAPAGWLDALDGRWLREMFDKLFACSVTMLGVMLTAWRDEAADGAQAAGQQGPPADFHELADVWTQAAHSDSSSNGSGRAAAAAGGGGGAGAGAGAAGVGAGSKAASVDVGTGRRTAGAAAAGGVSPRAPAPSLSDLGQQGLQRDTAAALMLRAVSDLQFCKVGLPLYTDLVRQLVTLVTASPTASIGLLHLLPCYEVLIQAAAPPRASSLQHPGSYPAYTALAPATPPSAAAAHQASGSHPPPLPSSAVAQSVSSSCARWQVDAVQGAAMAFLLPIAAACVAKASDVPLASMQLLPYTFLYLKHPQGPLARVAHTSYASIVSHLCDAGHADLAAHTLPYYVQRALQLPWTVDQLEGLALGLPLAEKGLPAACPESLYCAQYIIEAGKACLQGAIPLSPPPPPSSSSSSLTSALPQGVTTLAALPPTAPKQHTSGSPNEDPTMPGSSNSSNAGSHQQYPDSAHWLDFSPLYTTPGATASSPSSLSPAPHASQDPEVQPHIRLLSLACSLVLLVDLQQLPQVADMVADMAAAAQGPARVQLLQHLHDLLLRSDDYTRRVHLWRWFMQLQQELLGRSGGQAQDKSAGQQQRQQLVALL